jgi:hypothetical protein
MPIQSFSPSPVLPIAESECRIAKRDIHTERDLYRTGCINDLDYLFLLSNPIFDRWKRLMERYKIKRDAMSMEKWPDCALRIMK